MNENENLWDTAKAVLRGKFIALKLHTLEKRKSFKLIM